MLLICAVQMVHVTRRKLNKTMNNNKQNSCSSLKPNPKAAKCCGSERPKENDSCCEPQSSKENDSCCEPESSKESNSCCEPQDPKDKIPCCGPLITAPLVFHKVGSTNNGITFTSSKLSKKDVWDNIKVRWTSSRMSYAVKPGLYAIGHPDKESEVLVTANYKLTFDHLRSNLASSSFWILVLDTMGINVWCAAGKGTFGTKELISKIEEANLLERVSHRRIILPQLGAPGVAAHQVKNETGFKVVYGPVMSNDILPFIKNGKKASPQMRRKYFPLKERIALIPIELIPVLKVVIFLQIIFTLLSGILGGGPFVDNITNTSLFSGMVLMASLVSGLIITPMLLPYLPGRAFSTKNIIPGLLLMAIIVFFMKDTLTLWSVRLEIAGWVLMSGAIGAFYAMNFTGASTYTSLSGVKKEMGIAIPVQIASGTGGFIMWLLSILAF
jgi:CO dehydrogenase/acetyl-CoA synthase delta subunit